MSNKLYIPIIIGALGMLSASDASAQRMAVKSNLLADALASPNIGVEFLVSPRWTLDIAAHYQPFAPRDGRRWKHWLLQPEARRWLCTPFAGHFWGVHALGGRFNVGGVHLPFNILKGAREARYEGFWAQAFRMVTIGCFPRIGVWKQVWVRVRLFFAATVTVAVIAAAGSAVRKAGDTSALQRLPCPWYI